MVYLIDFGLSKEFRNPKTHKHIPYRDGLSLTGTAMFASIQSHLGVELGRRDDLESLAYILIYSVCKSGLVRFFGPKLKDRDRDRSSFVLELKKTGLD